MQLGERLLRRIVGSMLLSMRGVPEPGMLVDMVDGWRRVIEEIREEQARLGREDRIKQLEELASMSPDQASKVAEEEIASLRKQGRKISPEMAEAIRDLASVVPSQAA